MPIVIDPAAAQAAGTRVILRDMNKANEQEIDQISKTIRDLLLLVETDAPAGWRNTLDDAVAALKAAVAERKDIRDALQALP
jgi:Tat protein secretion system quality control protein TatD with DNase activity